MNRERIYDYLTRARAKVLAWTRPLTPEQYARAFPIGLGSLARVLTHTLISEWYYIQRIEGRDVPPDDQWAIQDTSPPPFATLESEWSRQAEQTRACLRTKRDWDATLEYRVVSDGTPISVTTTASDIFTQLAFHEVHHRAQAMNMLRQLGVTLEDIDFNMLMYSRRPTT